MTSAGTVEPGSTPEGLVLTQVSKAFGGVTAVKDASFSVMLGQIHGLIGPNGAGKSTVIGLVTGFLRPDSGDIRFGAHDLNRMTPEAIAQVGIARTFQKATPLVGLTALENILVGMHTRYHGGVLAALVRTSALRREERGMAERAQMILERFGLADDANTDAGDLPFGKLRFLEIARSMVLEPQLLLLDEPAAGLNRVEAARLSALIQGIRSTGTGVLIVDHDVPFVFGVCEQVTVMNLGQILASDHAAKIYENPAVREAYLGTQRAQTEAGA